MHISSVEHGPVENLGADYIHIVVVTPTEEYVQDGVEHYQ